MVRAHRPGGLGTAFPPRAARGKNGQVSDAGEFIDLSLQREASWRRAEQLQARLETEPAGSGLRFYGTSVGAVRGTVRDAGRRYPGLSRDEVTALSSELWGSALGGSGPGAAPAPRPLVSR